jgi:hypothetical protein
MLAGRNGRKANDGAVSRQALGYNGSPTSSCHTFLLEGASPFRRAFFLAPARRFSRHHIAAAV